MVDLMVEGKSMTNIRVILAEDHPVIRSHIRRTLQRTQDIVVIGEASDGNEMVEMACDMEPDIVLMDIEMPGLNGIEAANKLHEEGMHMPVLVISSHNDMHLILSLFKLGIAGYIIKEDAPTEIVPAVRAIAEDHSAWISHEIVNSIPAPVKEELIELDANLAQLFSPNQTSLVQNTDK
jgi:two-component system, NarL family, invasion response regulator UvrY